MIQQDQQKKDALIECLKKAPIVQVAVDKIGISRSTYYRWRHDDSQFSTQVDAAIQEGASLVNDLAESQLINAIKSQNLGALIFWLKNRHKAFSDKLELSGKLEIEKPLTSEEEKNITRALKMFGYKNDEGDHSQPSEKTNS